MMTTAWEEYSGHDVTSAFKGITTPIKDLYDEIHKRGWEVKKVQWKKDAYEAAAKSPSGEERKATGPDDATAVANLLVTIMRHDYVRASVQRKVGMWDQGSLWTDNLQQIAEAYAKAPIYDAKAAPAWQELAADSVSRAQMLGQQLKIEVVDEPEPYKTPQEMAEDVHKNKHFYVSRANANHPMWSTDQNIAFRVVHDVLGHCVSGGDFGWQGENLACAAHFPLLSPLAQKALFTECIGQTGYAAYYRTFGPQKVAFLDEFIEPSQQAQNSPAHTGIHPSQSVLPGATPQVAPSPPVGFDQGYVAPHLEGLGLTPVLTKIKTAGALLDPNTDWDSGITPPEENGATAYGDPLGAFQPGGVIDTAAKVDTGWANLTEEEAKQAIVNAFRVVLLSPRKNLKWNAIHYQDISHIPATVDDPKRYWDALESRRQAWNTARGYDPESHMVWWKPLQQFYSYVQAHSTKLGYSPHEARQIADQEFMEMWNEEEERIFLEDAQKHPDAQMTSDEMERKVGRLIAQRLKMIVKPKVDASTDVGVPQLFDDSQQQMLGAFMAGEQMDVFTGEPADKYGSWMGSHLKAIAQISRYSDIILQAALKDVHDRDGTGHHFRAAVLSLGVPGVGPKVCSFAWLLLQPLTSQLATIDTHIMNVLGHDYTSEMSDRDYFKFERELAAGRDASGYGNVPLGAFQWGAWDNKRTGPGTHQDHSAMRVLDPIPHQHIDWAAKNVAADSDWTQAPPEWWAATEPARQMVGDDWDQNVAPNFAKNMIPYQNSTILAPVTAASQRELHIAWDVPEETRKQIANWVTSLDWEGDYELHDPADYHITVMSAEKGWDDPVVHEWIRTYPAQSIPFEVTKVGLLKDYVVIHLRSKEGRYWATKLMDDAEAMGLNPSRFPGGFKAHISVGNATALPKGDSPHLKFRSGKLYVSIPRPLQHEDEFFLSKTAAAPSVMYHISPARNRVSIQAQGLNVWDGPSPYLWLVDDLALAQQMASKNWGASRGDNDIWQVDVSGMNVQPDPHPGGNEGELAGHSFIVDTPATLDRLTLIAPAQTQSKTAAEQPLRYFHSTQAQLTPGDIIKPASQGFQSYSEGMPGYDPNYVYVFDQRHLTNPEADSVYPNALAHTYEVEPLGPVEQDPEGEELHKLYEQRHGHPLTQPWYDNLVPGCAECQRDDEQGDQGIPEWYHPYNWRTSHARVIRPMDEDLWDELDPHQSKTAAQFFEYGQWYPAETVRQHLSKLGTGEGQADLETLVPDSDYQYQAIDPHSIDAYAASPERVAQYAALQTPFPPIIANEEGGINDGNHRILAAQQRGDETIDAFVPGGLQLGKTAAAPPSPMYHMTAPANVQSILANGINAPAYFYETPADAEIDWHEPGDTMLTVNTQGLPLEQDPEDDYGFDEDGTSLSGRWMTRQPVPAERVQQQKTAAAQPAPYFVHEDGRAMYGDPDQSIMGHMKNFYGESTEDVWAREQEVGKDADGIRQAGKRTAG